MARSTGTLADTPLDIPLPPHRDGDRIPAFSFAHGSPMLMPETVDPLSAAGRRFASLMGDDAVGGFDGPLYRFLQAFGPFLLERYKPRAIVIFSAHWEDETIPGAKRPRVKVARNSAQWQRENLYYDYHGFPAPAYAVRCATKPDHGVSDRVAELLRGAGYDVDFSVDQRGLDHGCFVPLRIMFGADMCTDEFPGVVALSMRSTPRENLALGKALRALRNEGILVLSGGLSIHTFNDWAAWSPSRCEPGYRDFERVVRAAMTTPRDHDNFVNAVESHPFYKKAHPTPEHFVPIYIAAGMASDPGVDGRTVATKARPDDDDNDNDEEERPSEADLQGRGVVVSDLHGAITAAYF